MRLLIDGYNVVAPVAGPRQRGTRTVDPEWLHRERMLLIQRLAEHLPAEIREQTCVVFDAVNPPKDRPHEFTIESIQIRFAVDYLEADDLIEEIIATHPAPKNLMVVSTDHRVQNSAKRRNCQTFDSQSWLDALLDNRLAIQNDTIGQAEQGRVPEPTSKPNDDVDPDEVDHWLKEFGFED